MIGIGQIQYPQVQKLHFPCRGIPRRSSALRQRLELRPGASRATRRIRERGPFINTPHVEPGFSEILERKRAELTQVLRNRDGIVIEKSADQMDEIQYASERDLAIRAVDRESRRLREVRAALRRIQEGSFGICMQCEAAIGPKRLLAAPSAPLCIECQEAADRDQRGRVELLDDAVTSPV